MPNPPLPHNWFLLLPHLTVALFAVVALMMAVGRGDRSMPMPFVGWISAAGCGLALLFCAWQSDSAAVWGGMFLWDGYARFFCGVIVVAALLVSLASASARVQCEYFAMLLLATVGLMFMATSGNLLMAYLSLELSTISLFVLAGFYRRRRKSAESAMKFLITAGTSSAIFLFGVSWVYGAVGSTDFHDMQSFFQGQVPTYAWVGSVGLQHGLHSVEVPSYAWIGAMMIFAGLAFKIAAAPFHLWAPDVYEGAPSMVTAFLSTASKGAGLVVLVRILATAMPPMQNAWVGAVIVLAIVTMTVGNLVAIVQTNIKRLLAYSGIAQAGFILIAVAAVSNPKSTDAGVMALCIYLLIYVFANIGAFLCVLAVSEDTEDHTLSSYDGLSRRSPMLAFAFLVFLLSLAGVPPFAGFVGKWFLFSAGMEAGLWGLVLFGAIASTVSLYYYLLVAKRMYIHAPAEDAPAISVGKPLSLAIGLCVAMTAIIGLYPAPWIAMREWCTTLFK
jgi:NADH-quinone oxidoreductase subunit N